jgi:hypothetical protein
MKLGKTSTWVLAGVGLIVAVIGVETVLNSAPPPPPPKPTDTRTIKEIMDTMVDPNGDIVFESVREISDDRGVTREVPQSAADWEEVRHALSILAEAPGLLTAEGRRAAPPGARSLNPLVENEPEEVDRLIASDRKGFNNRAKRFGEAVAKAQKAVEAKDVAAYSASLDGIAKACEACHLEFFYPNDKRAQDAAREDGI